MIDCRLLTTFFLTVLHTMTNCLTDDTFISREFVNVNVGQRIRIECELNNSTTNGNRKGLWLRLEDAEVFFYATSRINSDQRFQIEQRSSFHMINSSTSSEIITYSLIIDDLRLTDSGTYSCQADNKIIKLFLLNVVERPYFITNDYPTLLRTQLGRNISIACEAQGKPEPYLNWMKKTDEYNQKLMINCSTTPTTCQLNLVNVNRWNHGIYECVAMNNVGTIGRFYELDVQFPPYVQSTREEVYHSIGDAVVIECIIDANPEPEIKWLHRYSNEMKKEIDLTRQFFQENLGKKHEEKIWFIKNEQFNATRWKTSLFIQHIPRRLFNSNFLCRAINRHGEDEKSIMILENHHFTKKHRHSITTTVSSSSLSTITDQISLLTTTDEFLSNQINEITNRSMKHSFNLFIFKVFFIFILFI